MDEVAAVKQFFDLFFCHPFDLCDLFRRRVIKFDFAVVFEKPYIDDVGEFNAVNDSAGNRSDEFSVLRRKRQPDLLKRFAQSARKAVFARDDRTDDAFPNERKSGAWRRYLLLYSTGVISYAALKLRSNVCSELYPLSYAHCIIGAVVFFIR